MSLFFEPKPRSSFLRVISNFLKAAALQVVEAKQGNSALYKLVSENTPSRHLGESGQP